MSITRRRFLGGALAAAGAATTLTLWPALAQATPGDTRLLVVLLRGGLDGLHLIVPRGDSDYARLRGALAPQDALPLDGSFALHPALQFAHGLYGRRQIGRASCRERV